MKQAYGYIRVSGTDQVKRDGPVRQLETIQTFCATNGLEFVGKFEDLAVPGKTEGFDRPGFVEMVGYCATHGIKVVVIEGMHRLARDLIVSECMIRELREKGISLYSVDNGLSDQTTADIEPGRKLIRQIFSAMAEYDKSSLVLKLRVARERIRRETGRCEGRRFYGQDKPERIVRQLIQNLVESNVSWAGVAEMLNGAGIKKRYGKRPWTKPEVFQIYYGRSKQKEKQQGEKINHEPILP